MAIENGRKVWHANFVDLQIYKEDANGVVLNGAIPVADFNPFLPDFLPLLTYCYLQNATLSVGLSSVERRPITGRSHRLLTIGEFDDCSLECEHFFFRKAEEINLQVIFNRRQRLRLVCKLVNPEYGEGIAPLENDICQLTRAFGTQFQITVPENEIVSAQASFQAEEFL